jgi:hypothetical protein
LDGKEKETKSDLARKCSGQKLVMHSGYNEEHMKIQESERIEDLWVKQGKVLQGKNELLQLL